MSSNIALTANIRSNLLSLQGTASLMETAQNRLSTGKKVNSALDDAVSFFTAQGMSDRASSLNSLSDGISTALQTVKAASSGLDTISDLVKQAKAVAKQLKSADAADTGLTDGLKEQYTEIKKQIDAAAKDSSVDGVNLLQKSDATDGVSLKVVFDEKNADSNTLLKGKDFSSGADGLGLGTLTDAASVEAELTALDKASASIQAQQSSLGTSLTVLKSRDTFGKSLANVLQVGSDNLVNADTNLEAANVLALQTRQSLSQSALSLANQANQGVLQLLR
ncbi:flagellin N-terminal helical domain-containing protein [Methylobacterium thuringiense]|uniref:Flagellin n=1 Tax=Methylobacterium thuringiense TaxID=1003091 RepID=A0ABQ4TPP5_9HYPH|nr:flagellin [Methylobacterium thuringiense]GJE57314.1 Flagellin [Methylobacterium thuringiense]